MFQDIKKTRKIGEFSMEDKKFIVPLLDLENIVPFQTEKNFNINFESLSNNVKSNEYLNNLKDNIRFIYHTTYINKEIEHYKYLQYIVQYILLENEDVDDELICLLLELGLLNMNFKSKFKKYLEDKHIIESFELNFIDVDYPEIKSNLELLHDTIEVSKKCLKFRKKIQKASIYAYLILLSQNVEFENILFPNDDQLAFLQIIFHTKNYKILKNWLKIQNKENCDYEMIYIKTFDLINFIVLYLKEAPESIVIEISYILKSYRFLASFISRIDTNNFSKFHESLCAAYDSDKKSDVFTFYYTFFSFNPELAEKSLKKFIITFQTNAFSSIFFEKCFIVDSYYIESCMLCNRDISFMPESCFLQIIYTHYLTFFTMDIDIYCQVLRIIKKYEEKIDLEIICNNLFSNNVKINDLSTKKLLLFLEKFTIKTNIVFQFLLTELECLKQILVVHVKHFNRFLLDTSAIRDSLGSSIIFSEQFLENFYKIIFYMRNEPRMLEFLDVYIYLNFKKFIEICLFTQERRIDEFFIASIQRICEIFDDLNEKKLFVHNIISFQRILRENNLFLDILLFKCINFENLIKSTSFEKTLKDILNEKISSKEEEVVDLLPIDLVYFQPIEKNFQTFLKIVKELKHLKKSIKDKEKCVKIQVKFNYYRKLLYTIIKTIEVVNSYEEGLIFNNTTFVIKEKSSNFCLYAIYTSFRNEREMNLIEIKTKNSNISIMLVHNKVYEFRNLNNKESKRYLFDTSNDKHISIGIKFKRNKLKIHLNEKSENLEIGEIESIQIGNGFKGIIKRMLWYENHTYCKNYLLDVPKTTFYIQYLKNLEKVLVFKKTKGFYFDDILPYYFGDEVNLLIKNMFSNLNCYIILDEETKDIIECEFDTYTKSIKM